MESLPSELVQLVESYTHLYIDLDTLSKSELAKLFTQLQKCIKYRIKIRHVEYEGKIYENAKCETHDDDCGFKPVMFPSDIRSYKYVYDISSDFDLKEFYDDSIEYPKESVDPIAY